MQAVELLKEIGAYAMALEIINQRLSDAISAMVSGRLDGETKITGLVLSGNEVLEAQKTGVSRLVSLIHALLAQAFWRTFDGLQHRNAIPAKRINELTGSLIECLELTAFGPPVFLASLTKL